MKVLTDNAVSPERALMEHFMRRRRHTRGALVSVSNRNMLTNAAAARFVQEVDQPLLWTMAERATAEGQSGPEAFSLAGGMPVTARFEPVSSGSALVGALVHLETRSSVSSLPRRRTTNEAARPNTGWASLSPAQSGIAELVASGLTNQQAAARLCVSHYTVDFHLRQIFNKLGINSRVELACIVVEHRADERVRRLDEPSSRTTRS